MGLMKNGVSAVGKLFVVMVLAVTFLAGMLGVVYYQLRGEEVAIPKIVGKNFNDGKVDLNGVGSADQEDCFEIQQRRAKHDSGTATACRYHCEIGIDDFRCRQRKEPGRK